MKWEPCLAVAAVVLVFAHFCPATSTTAPTLTAAQAKILLDRMDKREDQALSRMKSEAADRIEALMRDNQPRARERACVLVAMEPHGLALLTKAATDPDDSVRRQAVLQLRGNFLLQVPASIFLIAAGDRDAMVRAQAAAALLALTQLRQRATDRAILDALAKLARDPAQPVWRVMHPGSQPLAPPATTAPATRPS